VWASDGQSGSNASGLVSINAHGAVHFSGTHLILELWRYADFSVLIGQTSAKPVFGQRVVLGTIPCFSAKDKDEVFAPPSTVRVSTKLLKILIAAPSPSVAY
jgi:hypothetical protein